PTKCTAEFEMESKHVVQRGVFQMAGQPPCQGAPAPVFADGELIDAGVAYGAVAGSVQGYSTGLAPGDVNDASVGKHHDVAAAMTLRQVFEGINDALGENRQGFTLL